MQFKKVVLFLIACFITSVQAGIPASPGKRVWTLAAEALAKMCTVQGKVCDLQSAIEEDFAGTFTVYDLILEKACNNQTLAESIDSTFDELEIELPEAISKLCAIESKLVPLESSVEHIDSINDGIFTELDNLNTTLCSKIEQVSDELVQVQSTIDDIVQTEIDHTQTILSKLDHLDDQVFEFNSALDALSIDVSVNDLDSCTDVLVSLVDDLVVDICNLETDIENGFAGTFTALDAQLSKSDDLVSLVDIADPVPMVDFSGVFTSLDALEEKVCTMESLVDIVCLVNTNELLCFAGSKIDIALNKMRTAESVIDPLTSVADAVISKLDEVDMVQIQDVCSNIEEAISKLGPIESKIDLINDEVDAWPVQENFSKLENIENELLTVCSKLDQFDVTDSKFCVVDSKIDAELIQTTTICSLIDEINGQLSTIDSKVNLVNLNLQIIESKVCNIDDDTFTICSNLDVLNESLETTDNKLDNIAPDASTLPSAYVANASDNTVTPIGLITNTPGTAIAVGADPRGVAISPNGAFAYVTNNDDNTVTPIDLATNIPGTAIPVGAAPRGIAITPDGAFAYVTNHDGATVTPINLATNTPGAAIAVGNDPYGIAITPDGAFAYVTNCADGTVTPINLATNTPGTVIAVGNGPIGIAATPNGAFAYVANGEDGTVTPINLATDTPGTAIPVAIEVFGIAITPNGAFAYVTTSEDGSTVIPINLATDTPGTAISVGSGPLGIAITPDGAFAYVANRGDDTVTPIDLATDTPGMAIPVGDAPFGIAIRGAIEGSPSVFGIASKVDVIESKICALDVSSINLKLDITESLACVIESNMDIAGSLIGEANMKAIDLEGDFASTWTILDAIENKLCASESVLEIVDSKLDGDLVLDFTGVFTEIDTILLKECTIDSKVDIADSLVDIFVVALGDLSGTYTSLDTLLLKVCAIDSQIDKLSTDVIQLKDVLGIPIFNSDLPLTINAPGRYYLSENLLYVPSGTGTAAITIAVNDVTLDLNTHSITQENGTGGTANTIGIEANSSLSNIRIENGFIHDLTRKGISFNANCSNILLEKITVDSVGTVAGAGFAGDNSIDFDAGCSQIIMRNCMVSQSVDDAIFFIGSGSNSSTDILVKSCNVKDSLESGFAARVVERVFYKNCHAQNVVRRGMTMDGVSNFAIEQCLVSNNLDGIELGQGSPRRNPNGVIRGCIVSDSSSSGLRVIAGGIEEVIIHNNFINNLSGIFNLDSTGSSENSYIAFNNFIENSTNIDEISGSGANTYLGNFAFNSTAVGDPNNTNYNIDGGSDITGKFSTVSQTSSFVDRPTKWTNINMLP